MLQGNVLYLFVTFMQMNLESAYKYAAIILSQIFKIFQIQIRLTVVTSAATLQFVEQNC